MTINLIVYSEETFAPSTEGAYLVRTVSNTMKTVRMFSTRVHKTWSEKDKEFVWSIDVSRQKVTHISEHPIDWYILNSRIED